MIKIFNFISGGLTAVMWTDFVQTIIMILGAAFLMVVCKLNKTNLCLLCEIKIYLDMFDL